MTGVGGGSVDLPAGATDAALTQYHVDRGKLFVQERFGGHGLIDVERVKRYIEPTRFPGARAGRRGRRRRLPGLVRAADLIGQLSDPRYLRKIPALFFEFEETGVNRKLGYSDAGRPAAQLPQVLLGQRVPVRQATRSATCR